MAMSKRNISLLVLVGILGVIAGLIIFQFDFQWIRLKSTSSDENNSIK